MYSNDWYIKGKIEFLAKRVFVDSSEENSFKDYDIDDILENGLCKDHQCSKCLPFKNHIKLLKRYTKTKDIKERSKIMGLLTKIENRMVVPRKYLLNSDSKIKAKGSSVAVPCLRSKQKRSWSRSRLTSQDSSEQKTKDTIKPGDISNLDPVPSKSPRTATKGDSGKHRELGRLITKKRISNKRELKKMNILYTSWNIKI